MAEKIIDNISELLLEIIGYLAPISYLVIVLSLIPSKINTNTLPSILDNELILLISIYGCGYLLRSFSMLIGSFNFFDLKKKVGEKLTKEPFFEIVKKDFIDKNLVKENSKFNTYRNICLSRYPEINNKVYLFMFRSDLFFDLFIINLGLLIIFVTDIFIPNFFLFDTSVLSTNILVVVILVSSLVGLSISRFRFFLISYKIPLTHHISKMEKS